MNDFELFLGIDYSGAATPESALPGLQVYAALPGEARARAWRPEAVAGRRRAHWSRRALAERLLAELERGTRLLAGIDHGFSLPQAWFTRHGLGDWDALLADFAGHWPTHREGVTVEDLRRGRVLGPAGPASARRGDARELRLTDSWTASAKSVFQFDVQGSVAKSTHAGLPWLGWLRERAGERLHVWPFDGWQPAPGRAVLVEAYPSLVRRRYPRAARSADEQDAYALARWLADMAGRGELPALFAPPLTAAEQARARREGWILGVR